MSFVVGLSHDLADTRGAFGFNPALLGILDRAPGPIRWELMPETGETITPDQTARYDAIYLNTQRVSRASFDGRAPRVRVIARHGVGFDAIDLDALTARGIVLTNTPEAVRRPVAAMALTFMLALGQRLLVKDRLIRAGRWAERGDFMGQGLSGRVLGMVGAGGIAREIARLVEPFDMEVIACGRAEVVARGSSPVGASPPGLPRVSFDRVLREADYLVVICPLDDSTRHLVDRAALARMKPGAYLINVARGAVVDEAALIDALQRGVIAGAGLDVFEQEPVDPANPLLRMDNVVLSPHSLCWTDETFDGIARTALASIVEALAGRAPRHVVNKAVLAAPDRLAQAAIA